MNTNKKYSREELIKISKEPSDRLLLDLGCGLRKKEGHIGIDTLHDKNVDICYDVSQGIPCEDNSVDGIYSNFLFEHIGNTIFLFQEIYRVCRKDAIVEFRVPYYQSVTQFKDPTHKAIIPPEMLRYFSNDRWYGSDYRINTNFKLVKVSYCYLLPFSIIASPWMCLFWPVTYPILLFCRRFFWNVVHSITIKLLVLK